MTLVEATLERIVGHLDAGAALIDGDSSGDGGTLDVAIDEAVPVPVFAAALFERFSSRGQVDLLDRVLSAMRVESGDHVEKGAGK